MWLMHTKKKPHLETINKQGLVTNILMWPDLSEIIFQIKI